MPKTPNPQGIPRFRHGVHGVYSGIRYLADETVDKLEIREHVYFPNISGGEIYAVLIDDIAQS